MKLFVIGDIHGCLNELIKLLALVDTKIQKDDQIVFVGDYIDRGPDSKGVIDLLIRRAKDHPNKHIFLRGNHEDMMLNEKHHWAFNGGSQTLKSYGSGFNDPNFWSSVPMDHREFLINTKLYYQIGRTVVVHAGLDPTIPLRLQTEDFMLWDRRFFKYEGKYFENEFVVIGHTPKEVMQQTANQLAIDTGCVFGGKLTCAVIEPNAGALIEWMDVKSEYSW